jgi:hypothetical protein
MAPISHPEHAMSDPSKPTVTACAPSKPGPYSELANQVLNSTSAVCVALVLVFPDGSGAYSIAGALEAQLPMPDLLEGVARELRTQLGASLQ